MSSPDLNLSDDDIQRLTGAGQREQMNAAFLTLADVEAAYYLRLVERDIPSPVALEMTKHAFSIIVASTLRPQA